MSRPLRRAGRHVEAGGRLVTWLVAEGARGRRWRWSIADREGRLVVAHTLELGTDGRFVKLESVAAPALLTLHRETDGSIHGNRVTPDGVDHLAFAAPAPYLVLVGTWDIAEAIAARAASADLDRWGQAMSASEALEVDEDLVVRVIKASSRTFTEYVEDEDGLPLGLATTSWPLELA